MELLPGFLDNVDPEDYYVFIDPQPESKISLELFKATVKPKTFKEKLAEIFGSVFA